MKTNLKIKNNQVLGQDYRKRLQRLENRIKYNQNEINRLSKESTKDAINKVDRYFNDNLKELNDLIEIANDMKDDHLKNYLSSLDSLYKEVQNNYLNKKIEIIDEKMDFVNKSLNDALEEVKENTNTITGNLLFSVISILLGISLVSAMTGTIKDMEPKYYFAYYVTIGWLAILFIGFSYLLIRVFDNKSKMILGVIFLATLLLGFVFSISFVY